MFFISGDPAGQVHEEKIKGFVQQLATQWNEIKDQVPKPKWWQFWKRKELGQLAVKFLLDCVDVMVKYVDDIINAGPDKKATVLIAMAALYDLVVTDLLPIWLKPFATGIKQIIIYTVVSLMIDFFVKKYREGMWKKEEENAANQLEKAV